MSEEIYYKIQEIYEEQEEENENTDTDDAYELLTRAVVKQAVKDYFRALDKRDSFETNNIEKFFKGAWFKLMYGKIDSDWFIKNLRELYESEKNNKRNDNKGTKKIY